MNHIDITLDFEACGLAPTSAVMQLAAVAWNRDAKLSAGHPFPDDSTFNTGVDLRTCVVNGFTFDDDTVQWWSSRSEVAKQSVTNNEAWPVDVVIKMFLEWIDCIARKHEAETVCLWAQGSDYDVAILRNIIHKFGIKHKLSHQYIRDARTFILESAMTYCDLCLKTGAETELHVVPPAEIMKKPSLAYVLFGDLPKELADGGCAHDPLFDCRRTSYVVWRAMKSLERICTKIAQPNAADKQ